MSDVTLNFAAPTRAVAVAEYIEERILERKLQPGDRIGTKDELRRESGVARATVNEAVQLLHDRGRITMRTGPQGGLFVAKSDPGVQLGRFLLAVGNDVQSVADAMALRDFLETMILQEATAHRTDKDIADLRQCLVRLRETQGADGLFLEAVWALHRRIADITPNVVLQTTYWGLVQFIREHVQGAPASQEKASQDFYQQRFLTHTALVDVIASGDLSRVDEAIRVHNEAASSS